MRTQALLLVLLGMVVVMECSTDPTLYAVYEGEEMSDAFSSIHYMGEGVVLAGKRSSTVNDRIFRSENYGLDGTWSSVGKITG